MSDSVWIAAIGLANTVALGYFAIRQNRQAVNIQKIETATNSMKDQLVAATKTASHAEGKLEGIAQEQDKIK